MAARRLIERRRHREALDVLNDAIRIDPRNPDSFQLRAQVFETLGMLPQADADRRRSDELGGVSPPPAPPPEQVGSEQPVEEESLPEEEDHAVTEDVEKPTPDVAPAVAAATWADPLADGSEPADAEQPVEPRRTPRVAPMPRYAGRPPSQHGGGAATARSIGTLLVIAGLFVAFGVGIYIALSSVSDALNGGDGEESTASGSPTPSGEASPSATSEAPPDALSGSPLDFEALAAGWKTKGIEAIPGDENTDIIGFQPTPVNVTLSRGADEMEVALLLYATPQGVGQDWTLGDRPTPKEGREIPEGSPVWYNLNAVVIVLEPDDALRADALEGFLSVNA